MSMGETYPKKPIFGTGPTDTEHPATGTPLGAAAMGQSRDPQAAPTSLLRLNLLFCLLQDAFDGVVGAGLRCPDPRRDAT